MESWVELELGICQLSFLEGQENGEVEIYVSAYGDKLWNLTWVKKWSNEWLNDQWRNDRANGLEIPMEHSALGKPKREDGHQKYVYSKD